MKRKFVVEIISFLIIFLFVYAALNKLMDVEKFQDQISQSPLLTDIAWFVSWFIIICEVSISIILTIYQFRLIGLLAAFSLMLMFTAYIISILQSIEQIPCDCGGVLESLEWAEHLIFNVAFILLAVTGIVLISGDRPDLVLRPKPVPPK